LPNIRRISPVFAVEDVKAAIDWYGRALGFAATYINRDDGDDSGESWNYALLAAGDKEIHLCKKISNDATLSSASNCYFYVDEIRTLHGHLSRIGADVTDLMEMPWGNVECWLHDPDGNRMVLSCPQ
jgi:uncharacterized glyoxalase superfamily protein PhnB